MLVDPAYADLMQAIGQASLGADDKMVRQATPVYDVAPRPAALVPQSVSRGRVRACARRFGT